MSGITGPGTMGSNASAQTFLTNTGEAGSLPNSRIMLAGNNITFDDSTVSELTLDVIQRVLAAPTASVGLSAIPGSATSVLRSDAAPALDQSIAPTWTGAHIFTAPVAVELESTAPRLLFDETDATTDERLYDFTTNNGQLLGRLRTDADGPGTRWLLVDRNGTTITSVNLIGATINLAGALASTSGSGAGTGTSVASFVATNKLGATTAVGPAIWLPITINGTAYVWPLWLA